MDELNDELVVALMDAWWGYWLTVLHLLPVQEAGLKTVGADWWSPFFQSSAGCGRKQQLPVDSYRGRKGRDRPPLGKGLASLSVALSSSPDHALLAGSRRSKVRRRRLLQLLRIPRTPSPTLALRSSLFLVNKRWWHIFSHRCKRNCEAVAAQ